MTYILRDEAKEKLEMTSQCYVQPFAVHRIHPERLLLANDDGRCFLWIGEAGAAPVEIPARLAQYLLSREEMEPLAACQRMWFVLEDLPVRPVASPLPDLA